MKPGRLAALWIVAAAACGAALLVLHPKSAEPDAGFHFLKARWAFHDPGLFVDVWARPLFQAVFAIPAQAGFLAARLFALLISLAAGWSTFRLAERLGFPNAPLAIPLLFLQPVWLVYASDTMTEPLFALVFVVALRLRFEGYPLASMLTASLLPLARPEGFVIVACWAVWMLWDRSEQRPWMRRVLSLGLLAMGTAAWWLAALLLSGDPLYILHNWPAIWDPGSVVYGRGAIYAYARNLPEIVGPILLLPFLAGLATLMARRRHRFLVAFFFSILVLHAVIWFFGRFGSVGYSRYLICVAPATALIALAGWNRLGEALSRRPRWAVHAMAAVALAGSLILALDFVEAQTDTRDAESFAKLAEQFRKNSRTYSRFAWSQPHACILFDRNPDENPLWTASREENLKLLRALPEGTLVLWDRKIGGSWYHLTAADFYGEGFSTVGMIGLNSRVSTWLFRSEDLQQQLDLMWKSPAIERPRR